MFKHVHSWLKKYEKYFIVITSSITLTTILVQLDFHFLESSLYDFRMTQGPHKKSDQTIALVTLDDQTTQEMDDFAPLNLNIHAQFLSQLTRYQPKAVGYLIDMNHVKQVTQDQARADAAQDFLTAAKHLIEGGSTLILGTPFDVTGEVAPPFPLSTLPHALAIVHKDGNVFSEDKITRRALLSLDGSPSFHLKLAQDLRLIPQNALPPGAFRVPEADAEYFFFRYHGDTRFISHSHQNRYPTYSFSDLLKGRIDPKALQGKIVLVGMLSKDDSTHFAFTPYSRSSFTNPKLLVHADILDSVIHQDGIRRAPPFINTLITLALTTLVLWWIMTSTPWYGVFATAGLTLALVILSHLLFQIYGIWIKESQPLVGIFLSYYLAIPYRLIREYKKRWDYQNKNQLLMQVEEMKTHFISLVTHDLKTPVAKIQGLTEVLLLSKKKDLTPEDRKTLQGIYGAGEELNRFITSILELNRVESNHLRFQFESKDINSLIEKSIIRLKDLAESKQIQIYSNLEPLFPIRVDTHLIEKVLNNLIDNAIKYSPTGARIEVESKEVDSWIIVTIRDYGFGMTPEEQKGLFTRFYRAKNDDTTSISGTGLGLYLSRYFIEAHGGSLKVQSEKNQGSTFQILLPIASPQAAPSEPSHTNYLIPGENYA